MSTGSFLKRDLRIVSFQLRLVDGGKLALQTCGRSPEFTSSAQGHKAWFEQFGRG